MRQALSRRLAPRDRTQPITTGQTGFIPAPSEGWDTETPVSELPQTRARVLDNWIPKGVQIEIRKGYSEHATGLGAAVETLMPYNAGASSALFAAAGTAIYNATSAGAIGSAVQTSLTNARWSWANITTSGGSFLWICNGVDNPRHWNGSAWATPSLTITTYTDNDISFVTQFKERLFFIFKNTLTYGYLPIQSIAGTVSNVPLGAVFNLGGRLVAAGTLSRDGGSGPNDYIVWLTSAGEIAVYQGSDPGDATDWGLVGVYFVGEPVGDRPFVNLGVDLGVITRNGLISVLKIMAAGTSPDLVLSETARVLSPVRAAIQSFAAVNGWEGIFFPAEGLLILNAPTDADSDGDADSVVQFVRYQLTGGWGRFTGWGFATFVEFMGQLYAGGLDGDVHKCFSGYSDNGALITAALWTAWSTLDAPTTKTLMEARPILTSATRASLRMVARTDFQGSPLLGAWPSAAITNALVWGAGLWGVNLWGGEDGATRNWRAISGTGTNISLVVEARTGQTALSLNGFNLRWEYGGQV